MRYFFYLLILAISFHNCSEPVGYNIQCKVEGLNNATVFLSYYYGETSYVADTARSNEKGEFRFEGTEPLHPGVYAVTQHTNTLFNLVIGADQHFSLKTKPLDYNGNMSVSGDHDNDLYFDYLKYDARQRQHAQELAAVVGDSTAAPAKRQEARRELDALRNEVVQYQRNVVDKNPGTTTAVLFKAGLPSEPSDSSFQEYKHHYFDNFDLGNEILIRMPYPVYQDKVNDYLDNLVPPNADSVIMAIEEMVAMAKENQETYKYLVLKCMEKYQRPSVMGMDRVFVHLIDTYLLSGEMDFWANDQLKKNLKAIADPIRNSMVGMKAQNLIMEDMGGKMRSLYDIKSKYTVVYFFDPDCGMCQKETPKLKKFYNDNKQKMGVEVFAVSVDTSLWKNKEYVRDAGVKWITVNASRAKTEDYKTLYEAVTTPAIYVLDDQKTILAKKIGTESIEAIVQNHQTN